MKWLFIAVVAMSTVGCTAPSERISRPPSTTARIGLVEWDITSSATALAAGSVTLDVTTAGTTTHDLKISGEIAKKATPMLAPGETAVINFRADAGDHIVLWCSVPGHRQQGMERRLQIARDPAT